MPIACCQKFLKIYVIFDKKKIILKYRNGYKYALLFSKSKKWRQ